MTPTPIIIIIIVLAVALASGYGVITTIYDQNDRDFPEESQTTEINDNLESTTPTQSVIQDDLTPSPQPSPTKQPASQTRLFSLPQLIYSPGTITAQSETSITISSTDDPELVMDWYKDTIEGMGIRNVTSIANRVNDTFIGTINGKLGNIDFSTQINDTQQDTVIKVSLDTQ